MFTLRTILLVNSNANLLMSGVECTQDTVVALQALAEYAAQTSGNNARQNLAITVAAGTLTHSFRITPANSLVLQSVQVLCVMQFIVSRPFFLYISLPLHAP